MTVNPVIIVGISRVAKVAADVLTENSFDLYGFLSLDKKNDVLEINELPVLSDVENADYQEVLKEKKLDYFVGLDDSKRREKVFKLIKNLNDKYPINVIHSTAVISEYAKTAVGNFIAPHVVIEENTELGVLNNIFAQVVVESGAKIGDFNTLNTGCVIGKGAKLGNHVSVGVGAIVYPGVEIEDDAVIGAGAVVIQKVKKGQQVFGVPAKVV